VPIAEFKAHTARAAIAKPVKPASTLRDTLGETERNQILKALEQSQWVIAGPKGAAARLGMKRSTLQFRKPRGSAESVHVQEAMHERQLAIRNDVDRLHHPH
jgi:transcriptional regulator with GAF, ATPase, and Fis domain